VIYLDNQSTTRCDPRVLAKMLPYFSEQYGNAASKTHAYGWMAEAAVDLAREQVADAIAANTNEIVFCSGATEANNLALRGVATAYAERGKHLIVASTEHASVIDCARRLESEGWSLSVLPVRDDGLIDPKELQGALRPDTTLVSVMLVNNEIGVVQDIPRLAALVHEFDKDIIFHCDAAQGLGKLTINVREMGVDLLSLSAHKVYGPKGVGALWRRRRPRLVVRPLLEGGGHEDGLRPGTLAVPLIVGFGEACVIAGAELDEECQRVTELRDLLLHGLQQEIEGVSVNGSMEARVGGNLNVAFEGVKADRLVVELSGLAISTGSACTSATAKPSHVLAAIIDPERATQSVRFGLGRFTTREEITEATHMVVAAVQALRAS
jgi:cysteine desulfurase